MGNSIFEHASLCIFAISYHATDHSWRNHITLLTASQLKFRIVNHEGSAFALPGNHSVSPAYSHFRCPKWPLPRPPHSLPSSLSCPIVKLTCLSCSLPILGFDDHFPVVPFCVFFSSLTFYKLVGSKGLRIFKCYFLKKCITSSTFDKNTQ